VDPQPQSATGPVSPETQLTWKREAAEFAADRVANGATLGLGSGSTAELALQALAQRIKNEGLRVTGVPTSERTRQIAVSLGIPVADLDAVTTLDMSIDGADEVLLPSLDLVKGHGGALLREKMVAAASRYRVIVVDATKIVQTIGATGPIPVEVVPFGWRHTAARLEQLGARPVLRSAPAAGAASGAVPGAAPVLTDGGNYVLDCAFGAVRDPAAVASAIKSVTGVVDHGLFVMMTERVHVAGPNGVQTYERSL
jgi:ribose 5-phosphate isomerase A